MDRELSEVETRQRRYILSGKSPKSRNLVELLATRDLYPKGDIPPDILSQLDTLRRQVLSEERRLNQRRDSGNSNGLPSATAIDPNTTDSRGITNPNTPGIDLDRERLNTLKLDLDRLVTTHVQPIDPSFQLTQQVQPIDFATIQNALPNPQSAIVAWYISSDRLKSSTTMVTSYHQGRVARLDFPAYFRICPKNAGGKLD